MSDDSAPAPGPNVTFGLRSSRWLTPPMAWVSLGLSLGIAVTLAAVRPSRGAAYLLLWLVTALYQLWAIPVRVEVSGDTLTWRTLVRRVTVPLSELTSVTRSTRLGRRLSIQRRSGGALPIGLMRGTSDFLVGLENRCPGIELPDLEQLSANDEKLGAVTHFYRQPE